MPKDEVSNNRRIAKNTVYLYLRMIITSLLALYSARVVLDNLGVEDFGIYNVVGGVVTFMGFLTATMSSATQRFLTFNLGKGNIVRFQQTFSLLVSIFLLFCLIIFVVLEIVGPIYISRYMNLTQERLYASQWTFQISLIAFLINTFSIPYKSSIVAYEKMDIYAYIGVAESFFLFLSAVMLPYIDFDHLITYAFLVCVFNLAILVFIVLYCRRQLNGCHFQSYWDFNYFKELIFYSGWNLFGSVTSVMCLQGLAIVLNFFFGPVVNAAKAIADKVNAMVSQFSQNFYMAITPQIIKSYSTENIDYMRSLVINSSRYSFLMLFFVSVPLFVVMEPLLSLWIGKEHVSSEVVKFCQFTIVCSLVNVLEQPVTMAVRATGDIKKYQIVVGIITLSFLPMCIVLFILGVPAYYSMILLSIVFMLALIARVFIVSPIICIDPNYYFKHVVIPISFAVIVTVVILYLSQILLDKCLGWLTIALMSAIITFCSCFFCGLRHTERRLVMIFLREKFGFLI